jgi:hypothetical protein
VPLLVLRMCSSQAYRLSSWWMVSITSPKGLGTACAVNLALYSSAMTCCSMWWQWVLDTECYGCITYTSTAGNLQC